MSSFDAKCAQKNTKTKMITNTLSKAKSHYRMVFKGVQIGIFQS